MMKLSVLAVCGLVALSACTSSGPQVGPDGRPLPTVYKIGAAESREIPYRLLDSINTLRAAKGVVPMTLSAPLSAAATAHSQDMSAQNRPWHFGSDGSSPLLRTQRAGYGGMFLGELISETYETELETLAAWSAQPDTRVVMMDASANELGFGWYQEPNGKIWWTLLTGDSTRPMQANVGITALGATVTSEMDGVSN